MSTCHRIRSAMQTDNIGKLLSLSGTVTRTSEVRPELLYGAFTCVGRHISLPHTHFPILTWTISIECNSKFNKVEQQYVYTEPLVCKNVQCAQGKQAKFHLHPEESAFVDWQRLRVQENADEIPAGSMPRCIDIICRNEVVELAKAGDKIIFTGSVAVIPSSSGLARLGDVAISGKSIARGDTAGSGVTGLKACGVSELTYKMIYIACSIHHGDQRNKSSNR